MIKYMHTQIGRQFMLSFRRAGNSHQCIDQVTGSSPILNAHKDNNTSHWKAEP